GWYKDAAGEDAWDFAADRVPAEDVTLYAKWEVVAYTVSFDSQGGSEVASVTADYGSLVAAPDAPTHEGYTFVGWYKDAAGEVVWDFATDRIPAEDVTLYAKWEVIAYIVNFDSQGGSDVAPAKADFGALLTEPTAPMREGYTLVGW